jgi:hypothetical protein
MDHISRNIWLFEKRKVSARSLRHELAISSVFEAICGVKNS